MDHDREIVIVTGSSGLIGSAACRRLARRYHVVGFDRPGASQPPEKVEAVDVDLTSIASVWAGLRAVRDRHGDRIASVIHLAAYHDFSGEPSPKYQEVTVRGTERLLDELQGFRVGQFVFSSTTLVHAPTEPGRAVVEDEPLDPKWAYPQSKARTEALISARRGAIPCVLARIAGVYDDRCRSIPLAHQIRRIFERRLTSRVYPGDTAHGQVYVHLDDVVDALVLLVGRRAQLTPELTLLIGEPETLSYEGIQRTLGQLIHGEEWETKPIPKPLAKAGAWVREVAPWLEDPFIRPWMIDLADDHLEIDIGRARALLGWEPARSLRATLPKMVAALKADPRGWYRANGLAPPSDLDATAGRPQEGRSEAEYAGADARP